MKKVFVKCFAKFFEVFAKFFKVFASFGGFHELFEAFGSIRTHWVGTFSNFFETFWIFESFFDVSGRNFYNRLFSRHNMISSALFCGTAVWRNGHKHMAAAHLFVKPVTYTVSKFFASTRPAGRSAGRPGGARVVSGAEKKII